MTAERALIMPCRVPAAFASIATLMRNQDSDSVPVKENNVLTFSGLEKSPPTDEKFQRLVPA